MVALLSTARPPDERIQREAESLMALRDRARRVRDGLLPAHVIWAGRMWTLRPLPYPFSEVESPA